MRAATGRLWRFATWFRRSGEGAACSRRDVSLRPQSLGRAPLAVVFLAMASGIMLDRLALLPGNLFGSILFVAATWLVVHRWGLDHGGTVLLFLLVVLCASLWHRAWIHAYPYNDLANLATQHGAPCIVDGRVIDAPRIFENDPDPLSVLPAIPISRCRIEATRIRDGPEWLTVRGQGQLIVRGRLKHIGAGDQVRICGFLERPVETRNPGELSRKEFAHFRRESFRLRTTQPEAVELIHAASTWNPRYWLARFRAATERRLRALLPASVGNLSVALLLGAQECVEQESIDAFLATGTLHLLSISGLHVMILASTLLSLMLLVGIRDKQRMATVMAIIVAYAIFTEGRAPVIRAAMAILLWGCASLLHRGRTAWNALCAAGVLVLLMNPTHLFQVGAQLSFLAMFGIVVMFPWIQRPSDEIDPLDRLIRRSRPRIWRWSAGAWSSTVQMFQLSTLLWLISLPLVAASFHVVSLVAVAMNLIMWIPVWIAMVSGFAMLILVWLAPPLASPVAWIHGASLQTLTLAGDWGESITNSHIWVAGPGPMGLCVFYVLIVAGSLALRSRHAWWGMMLAASAVLAIVWPIEHRLVARTPARDQISAWVLSVGHGTCVVLETPTQVIVYDAGCLGNERFAADVISRFLWSRRIGRIDTLVISHADIDHFCAVPRLSQRFAIGRLCLTDVTWSKESHSVDILREAVKHGQITVQTVTRGDVLWAHGEDAIEVVHPASDRTYASDNAHSIVLVVQCGADRLLLPGDLEKDGMSDLIGSSAMEVNVALAPHHGSAQSAPTEFVDWCQPQAVIISGGNSTERQARETYRRLSIPTWHTAADGALYVELDDLPGAKVQRLFDNP